MNVAAVVTLLSFCATLALPGKCNYIYVVCPWCLRTGKGTELSFLSFLVGSVDLSLFSFIHFYSSANR